MDMILLFLCVAAVSCEHLAELAQLRQPLGNEDRQRLLNKYRLINEDAGLKISTAEVLEFTEIMRKRQRQASEKHHLNLEPHIAELERLFLAVPDSNPRGPEFKEVVAKANDIFDVIASKASSLELVPFHIDMTFLKLLEKNDITNLIRANLKKLGRDFDKTAKYIANVYVRGLKKGKNMHESVEALFNLLSQGDLSAERLDKEIQKIEDILNH
ncbi:unnamed protein product [Bursaphelenchus xylophilus]|uniref:(pine wood nematode) hypothetical protein n=1 Tax=Bursaphelenchus xylophilus TaxID=6326 RepID=A0A1I7SCV7_BURXY|nr:unnamed protein product [Bursaphelenchus xylophilus]CAG9093404.1 unnamed protein product [Bursaphelenchus xylophilus]